MDDERLIERFAARLAELGGFGLAEIPVGPDVDVRQAVLIARFDDVIGDDAVAGLRDLARLAPYVVVTAPWREREADRLADRLAGAGGSDVLLAGTFEAGSTGRGEVVILGVEAVVPPTAAGFRAAAIITTHNEVDMISETVEHLVEQGIEVHLFDDWSTDGTWDLEVELHRRGLVAHVARFPADGPATAYQLAAHVENAVVHGRTLDVDWVVAQDADEIRLSPWPGTRLTDALAHVDRLGYNAVDFTVLDFRYVEGAPPASAPYGASLDHFEFGRRPGHFRQVRAWRNDVAPERTSSGGHDAVFLGRRVFPLKFLLRHYPLRNPEQAALKVGDRLPRFEQEHRSRGWHTQYDHYRDAASIPGWSSSDLERWDDDFWSKWLIPRLTGLTLGVEPAAPVVEQLSEGVSYLDGSEAELLRIIEHAADVSSGSDELRTAIRDWPTRYHLSAQRTNLLRPLTIGPGMRVLDVGAGTGILARYLGETGATVVALEGSAARAEVAAARCRSLPNVEVLCGRIDDLDPTLAFDLVLIVGVLEYSTAEIGGGAGPDALLRGAAERLAPGGVLGLAIENKLGLKYLLGGLEDHHGRPWVGIEDYPGPPGARTWSRSELASMVADVGLRAQRWLAPFPDYKLPSVVLDAAAFSAPDAEDLVDQLVGRPVGSHDPEPVRGSDSGAALRSFVRAGLGLEVANSYFVVAGVDDAAVDRLLEGGTLAWIFGADRLARWRRARRLTSSREVIDDTRPTLHTHGWLTQAHSETRRFVAGRTLGQELQATLRGHDLDGARSVLSAWHAELRGRAASTTPSVTPPHRFRPSWSRSQLADGHLDVHVANFIRSGDDMVSIDDEWRVGDTVDLELVVCRALWVVSYEIVTTGLAHPWGEDATVEQVHAALAELSGLELRSELIEAFREAEVDLQVAVTGLTAEEVRAGWLDGSRSGVDSRADRRLIRSLQAAEEQLRVRGEEIERLTHELRDERDRLAEVDGQRMHHLGEIEARDATIARLQSLRGGLAAQVRRIQRRVSGRTS